MKHILTFLYVIATTFGLIQSNQLIAATCTTTAPGVWDCGTPTGTDDLIVNHDVTITGNFTLTGSIIVNTGTLTFTGGTITFEGTSNVTVNSGGSIQIDGNLDVRGDATLTVSGNMNVDGNVRFFDSGTTLNVTGTGNLTIGGDFRFRGTGTVDGTLAVTGQIRFDSPGAVCGTGTITYGSCGPAGGTACGDSGWCDDSGTVTSGSLPIELLWFKAQQNGTLIDLSWMTASEINNDFFTVEKLLDLETKIVLTTVKGKGDSQQPVSYFAIDPSPNTGINYYLLKQTDFDGTYTYSNIISTNFTYSFPYISIFPNPIKVGDEININLYGAEGPLTLFVFDTAGRVLKKELYSSIDTQLGLRVIVQELFPGSYIIRVIGTNFSISEHIVVSH